MKRRTLIRLLVGLGIGVPIAIEGVTFLGLIGNRLSGDGRENDDGTGGAVTPTATDDGAAVGDELLPGTTPTDRLSTATISATGSRWTLTLSVFVENDGDVPYELRLESVRASGKLIEGGASTGRIPPGETGVVSEQWDIPPGSTPRAVRLRAIVGDDDLVRWIELADIAVSG